MPCVRCTVLRVANSASTGSVVTVYAFSIENFKRPADEVSVLMKLGELRHALLCNCLQRMVTCT